MLLALPLLLRTISVSAIVFAYYLGIKSLFVRGARILAFRTRRFSRYSRSEVKGVLELAFAVGGHVILVTGLVVFSGVPLDHLGLVGDSRLLALALVVGVGELALAMLICQVIMTSISPASNRKNGMSAALSSSSWISASRAGWVRHHVSSLRVLPLPISMTLSGTQVACEELVFRAILIPLFLDAGVLAAVSISGVLFVVMQVFFMPSWQAAMFPVVGALIMALVHGVLFANTPFIWPLVVAHAAFFYIAVL